MPLYEYQCESCQKVTERIQKYSDPLMEICPACGGTVKKLLSSPAFQFKGTGWYITDYARKSSNGSSDSSNQTSGSSDKSEKSEKSAKADKSEKSEKSDRAEKSEKSEKSESKSESSTTSSTKSDS
jgi:putative FmdB family regulatory protein